MKTGLVMEGGAMRGLFTAGVTDVLMQAGVTFDGAMGVSAGAAFGCNYKSGQIGRVLRYNMKYSRDPRYCCLRSLVFTGDLFGADFCYRQIPEKLDVFDEAAYNKNPMAFYTVCTDVETGEGVYHLCAKAGRESLEWFRASASMPLAARMVKVDGRKMLDGGVADSIPLKAFEQMGYERNVVILTQPKGFKKEKNPLLPLFRVVYRRYPRLVEALEKRHESYNAALAHVEKQEKAGKALVIRPAAALPISRLEHDPQRMQAVHGLGVKAGEKHLEEIKAFLAK
ncbi:MAG: patatin family protein [Clostridia bacterium]|nr:patatin family protein [Clostridia bacterium]